MINGKRYSWEDVTITLPHGPLIDVDSIEYSDKKEAEAVYGKGSTPRGYGEGNYSAEGKVSLLKEEFDRLVDFAQKKGVALYRLPPFEITVSYGNTDEPSRTDVLRACKITETSAKAAQGDKSMKVDLSVLILNGVVREGLEPV